MNLARQFMEAGHKGIVPEQLIVQIADGDFHGLAQWWDARPEMQTAVREAIMNREPQFTFEHDYGSQLGTTRYNIDLVAMTSVNPDSGTERKLRVQAVIMW